MKKHASIYYRILIYTPAKNGTELFYSAYYYGAVSDEDYNRRSNLPKHYNYRDADGELINGYTYAYDATGNISSETNAATNAVRQYTYDGQNQLTQVKDASGNTLYAYTYDTVGNIRSKADGSATHTYAYGNTQWADQLTAFDGHAITYDGAGNPLTYYNGADYTLTWQRGRQLATAETNGVTATYTYDMSGVRNSKTVDGVSYEFTTLSGKLMRQTWSGNELQFVYDASGRPYMLLYTPANGATQTYYYVLNVQGDVVGLMDSDGDLVVRYSYDPWGKPLSVTDGSGTEKTSATFIGNITPLRYRGYYYDIETGFYYLQSRYYDPAISRFLNADSYITTDITGLLSGNMYAYCENNPAMCVDSMGTYTMLCTELVELDTSVDNAPEEILERNKKMREFFSALFNSVSFEAEIGMGFGGTFELFNVGVEAKWCHNYLGIYLNNGDLSVNSSEKTSFSVGITGWTVGTQDNYYGDVSELKTDEVRERNGIYNCFGSFSTGAGLYLGYIGGNISLGFDLMTFIEQIS